MAEMMAMDAGGVQAALAEDGVAGQQRAALQQQGELLERVLRILKSA
jgi:hypothetical protein